MPFDINNFTSNLSKYGVARASHYDVYVMPPTGVDFPPTLVNPNNIEHLAFRVETVEMPGIQATTAEFRKYGAHKKIAYGVLFDDIPMTFISSHNMREKVFFESWVGGITGVKEAGQENTYDIKYYDDYVSTVKILIYNETGENSPTTESASLLKQIGTLSPFKSEKDPVYKPTYVVTLNKAYPVNLTSTSLNRSGEELIRTTVNFTYQSWQREEWSDIPIATKQFLTLNPQRILGDLF